MDVALSPEQRDFAEASAKLAADLTGGWSAGRGPATAELPAPSAEAWARIEDAGWPSLRTDGGSCVDVCVLAEQLGSHHVPAPVLGALIVSEQLRLRGADAEGRRLAPVLTGDLRAFSRDGSGVVVDAAGAEAALVAGTTLTVHEIADPHAGADLTRVVGTPGRAMGTIEATGSADVQDAETAFALTVVAADLLGVMQSALDAAVEHARTRQQFGHPIGSFQAIQHLLAECLVSVEGTRSAVWYAAWAVDDRPPAEALVAARTAKAYASAAAVEVVEASIQTFGGIGMTWEADAHVRQRRAHLDRRLFGDEHAQYRALAGEAR